MSSAGTSGAADRTERALALAITGPIVRADLPAISGRVCSLFARNRGSLVYCDVTGVDADAVAVEALARLQLVAKRNACRVVLRHPAGELRALVELLGLTDVLPESP